MVSLGYEPIEEREMVTFFGEVIRFKGELGLFEDSYENARFWEVWAGDCYFRADLSRVITLRVDGGKERLANTWNYLTHVNKMVNYEMARRGWSSDKYVLTCDGNIALADATVTLDDGRVFHVNKVATCEDTGRLLPTREMVFAGGKYRLKEAMENCEYCGSYKERGVFCPHCDTVLADGSHAPRALTSRYLVYRNKVGVRPEYYLKGEAVDFPKHDKCVLCDTWFPKRLVTNGVCYQCLGTEMSDDDWYDKRLKIDGMADITGYHHHDKDRWYGEPDKGGRFEGLGFELEIDRNPKSVTARSLYNNMFAHFLMERCGLEKYECVFETDGSLDNGFEIISMPHTVEDFWSKKGKWMKMLAICEDAGYRSHDANTCGLHVHVSRSMFGKNEEKIDYNLGKIHRLYSERWDDFVKASRRRNFHYCEKNLDMDVDGRRLSVKSSIRKWSRVRKGKHGFAINDFPFNDTVEFRLGRGTLDDKSFFAWIDLTLTIVRNSRKSDRKLRDASEWLEGMRDETRAYLQKTGAFIDVISPELGLGGGA